MSEHLPLPETIHYAVLTGWDKSYITVALTSEQLAAHVAECQRAGYTPATGTVSGRWAETLVQASGMGLAAPWVRLPGGAAVKAADFVFALGEAQRAAARAQGKVRATA